MRKCAKILEDTELIRKLSSGGMMAQYAMYHAAFLSLLYQKTEKASLVDVEGDVEKQLHGIS